MKKLILTLCLCCTCAALHALEITRYVSIGGTGDGLTPETPTADLGEVLSLSTKVDYLTVYVAPGFYSLNVVDYGEGVAFRNVTLDGTWKKEDPDEKVRINYPGVTFSNSFIRSVSFSGNVVIDGGVMHDSDADKVIYASFDSGTNVELINCEAKSFASAFYGYGKNVYLRMAYCYADKGSYGLQTKNVHFIECNDCKFREQSEGGINIDNSLFCFFADCEFGFNSGDGAVRVTNFDKDSKAFFYKCEFTDNYVTNNHAYNMFLSSPGLRFYDCLFAENTVKDIDRKGFVHIANPDFMIMNCSFINNKGGVEMESFYPDNNQIVNCLFWNNGKTVAYAGGYDVPMQACAMDHGTGIPELDREKGLILLTDDNKGFEYNGMHIVLQPNSPLVNAGVSRAMSDTDLYGHARSAFGGTDIGCVEFVGAQGLWTVDPSQQAFEIEGKKYLLCKATANGVDYYSLIPESVDLATYSFPSYFYDWLYLDTMPVKPVLHEGKYIERHTKTPNGKFKVDVYEGSKYGGFYLKKSEEYSSAAQRPKVKITGDNVELVKPAASKTTGKSTTNKSYKK